MNQIDDLLKEELGESDFDLENLDAKMNTLEKNRSWIQDDKIYNTIS